MVTILELTATTAGLLYLSLAVQQRPLCWAFYIVSAAAYLPVFLSSALPIYALFQLLFIAQGLYGLFRWGVPSAGTRLITSMSKGAHVLANALSVSVLLAGVTWIPHSGSMINAGADLFLSVYSLTATVLTIRRYCESWIYWGIINGAGVITSLSNHLYLTSVFFLINLAFSAIGFQEWRVEMKRQHSPGVPLR